MHQIVHGSSLAWLSLAETAFDCNEPMDQLQL